MVALITFVFNFVDSLAKLNLHPETRSKLKKSRDELEKELKVDAEKEKKEQVKSSFLSLLPVLISSRASSLKLLKTKRQRSERLKRNGDPNSALLNSKRSILFYAAAAILTCR